MTVTPETGCYSQSDLLSVEACSSLILDLIQARQGAELIDLNHALGRVAAADIRSPIDVPIQTHSAMDGYAVRVNNDQSDQPVYRLIDTVKAGEFCTSSIKAGEAVKIMTGAPLPEEANCVIPFEQAELRENQVFPLQSALLKPNLNIRLQGEEIKAGTLVIHAHSRFTSAQVALLAHLGIKKVSVVKRLTIGVLSTGNELTEPGESLADKSSIYDANRYSLKASLSAYPVDVIDYGILEDRVDTVLRVLSKAIQECDFIISTAGVSQGDADVIRLATQQLGGVQAYGVAMKPGKPVAFGRLGEAFFFGLPGNPVSSVVSFKRFVEPALRKALGLAALSPVTAILDEPIYSKVGRTEYIRAKVSINQQAELHATPVKHQGAAQLSGLVEANGLIEVPEESDVLNSTSLVQVWPLSAEYVNLF